MTALRMNISGNTPKPFPHKPELYIGTSGWAYPQWKNTFYPEGLKDKDRLSHYATQFNAVEINSSFYGLPRPHYVERWAAAVPEGFRFCFKVWRKVTHDKKLMDCLGDLDAFIESIDAASDKTGPLLLQLPPGLRIDALDKLQEVLSHVREKGHLAAVEFRHPSWYEKQTYRMLESHDASIVLHDMAGSEILEMPYLAPVLYLRYHGKGIKYGGSYGDDVLGPLRDRLTQWRADGKDAYVFFNNTMGSAADNARRLMTC